jgi:CHASE2 domain-containing sensor protein
MLRIKNFVYFTLSILPCCATKPPETKTELSDVSVHTETKVEQVVLVNAEGTSRCQMGDLILSISKCNPKTIAINYLFEEERDVKCDSILQSSMIDSDKVILLEAFKDDDIVGSHEKFRSAAFLSAPNTLTIDEADVVVGYHRMLDYKGKWVIGFPFLVALQLDKSRAAEFSSKLNPLEYPITFYHNLEEFNVFNSNEDFSNKCDLIKDKIVLIGSLGPGDEDIYTTPVTAKSTNKTYGTVVIANVILDILKELN